MPLLTLASFAFFTGLVGLVTYLLTRKDDHGSSQGYFLAGRTLTGGYIAGSLLLTNLSAEQLVGLNGAAFADGICVMAWEVIAAMSLVVMALFFLPRYLRSGITTVPQFLEERFDTGTRTITTLIFIFAYAGILLPIILYTGATGMAGILNMKEITGIESDAVVLWGTVWLIGLIGSAYAIFGGLRTVAVSDTLNGFGLLVGGALIVVFGLAAVNRDGMFAALETLATEHPEKFNSLGGPEQSVPFSTLFTGVLLLNLFYWTTNQQIIQRTFGASSLREGQKGVLIAGLFKALAPLILVLPGIIAFHLYAGDDIKNDHAYGTLVRNVLPAPLVGFFAAAVAGAILSSFNSALNSTATLFSLGVYKPMINPAADEHQVIRSGKIFGWIIALASMTVAPLLAGQESIFGYLQKMNGLYFIPIFSVMLVGMLTRRVPASAAKAALVVGFTVIAAKYFAADFWRFVPLLSVLLIALWARRIPGVFAKTALAIIFLVIAASYFIPRLWESVDAMHEFHFLGLVFACLIAMMLIIGGVAPQAEPWQPRESHAVDMTPWKPAWPVGLALIAFVLALYVWFARPEFL